MGSRGTGILFWNAQGIRNKKAELLHYLNKNKIPIALITETHLTDREKFNNRNYSTYRLDRNNRQGGGVAILVHKTVKHNLVDLPITNRTECVAIGLKIGRHTVTLICTYNPPGDIDINDIENLIGTNNNIILAGDLNAKHTDWGCRTSNRAGNKLRGFFYDSNRSFQILAPDKPTHYPNNIHFRPDILDIALMKNINIPCDITVENNLQSDHLPVRLTLRGRPSRVQTRQIPNYKLANWTQLKIDIENSLQDRPLNTPNDIDTGVDSLTNSINTAINTNIPKKSIRTNQPYLPDHILRLIRQRNDARRKWQRHHNNLQYRQEMNDLQQRIKVAIQTFVSDTWENVIGSLDTKDMPRTWNMVKKVTHKADTYPPLILPNGKAVTDQEKAEAFANHLERTFVPHDPPNNPQFTRETETMVQEFLNRIPNKQIRKTNVSEVKWLINHLPDRKAPGPDGIQNIVLKQLPNIGYAFLAKIINAMFEMKYFPKTWKTGRIILFPKPGKNPREPGNYRPITLLNTMSKVSEKIICKRLNHNLKQLNVIRDEQNGFRPKHSTVTQLMRLVEHITRGFNENRVTIGLYLDIKQAFDRVWHHGLLRKMVETGLDDGIIHLIAKYINNRQFEVAFHNSKSALRPVYSGVPQGSILGPTLFNIYINDIPHDNRHNNTHLYMYADDTLITSQSSRTIHASRQIQNNLNILEPWLEKWRIKINVDKCQAVLYTKRYSQYRYMPPQLSLYGHNIEWKNEAIYLGVTLDKKLLFKQHIQNTLGKAYGTLKLLYPILNNHNKIRINTGLTIYKALLRPVLTYASPIWGHAARTHIKKLQVFQNKLLYMITKLPRVTPVDILHDQTGVETIEEYIKRMALKFYNTCEGHDNPLVASLGTYETANNKHKRPKWILDNT